MPFTFDPNLATARTPEAAFYVDPAALEVEKRKIFACVWQPVGLTDELGEKGSFVTGEVAGVPIVVVNDGDSLRGFVNVCRHRAGPVAQGCGRRQTLQCRYHGWTYALDGRLVRAPEMETTQGFSIDEVALESVRVARFGPLVWVCLDADTPPIDAFWEGLAEPDPSWRLVHRSDSFVRCNWKVYVDNYLEGYHIPTVHPGLYRELDYDAYRTEPHGRWSLQIAPLRPVPAGEAAAGRRAYVPDGTDDDAAYSWMFPNVMLNSYQGQTQVNVVVPLGPTDTRVTFEWFAPDPPADPRSDPKWKKLIELSDVTQDEDVAICEAVQRGLSSGRYRPGRYCERRENGVHHFHGLLHERLRSH